MSWLTNFLISTRQGGLQREQERTDLCRRREGRPVEDGRDQGCRRGLRGYRGRAEEAWGVPQCRLRHLPCGEAGRLGGPQPAHRRGDQDPRIEAGEVQGRRRAEGFRELTAPRYRVSPAARPSGGRLRLGAGGEFCYLAVVILPFGAGRLAQR